MFSSSLSPFKETSHLMVFEKGDQEEEKSVVISFNRTIQFFFS